jgi:predicted RNA-binding Zn-ribbon protein involved in translation (DUF1610 family)
MERHLAWAVGTAAAQCWGKASYQSPQLAKKVATRIARARKRRSGPPPQVYRCPHCGLFHLGRLG